MKKVLLLAIITIAFAVIGQAKTQPEDQRNYRSAFCSERSNAGIVIDQSAANYQDFFAQAISRPNTEILVGTTERTLKFELLNKKIVEVKHSYIIYDNQTKRINHKFRLAIQKEVSYVIFLNFAFLLFMVVANILFKKHKIVANFCVSASILSGISAMLAIAKEILPTVSLSLYFIVPFILLLLTDFIGLIAVFAAISVLKAYSCKKIEDSEKLIITLIKFYAFSITFLILLFF